MTATLTDRYVHAVIRTVPEQQREDVSAELRAAIADQVDARLDTGEPREDAERAVLNGLGDPDKLAAGYADRPLHLIGPRYFLEWWRLLKLLLWIVVPLATFGIALGQTLAGAPIGAIIGSTIGGGLSVAVHLAFWTTLVFALVERSDTRTPLVPWTIDRLPAETPYTGARFIDLICSVIFLAVAAVALVWDQLVGLVYLEGQWMPFLSPALWPWWATGLLIAMGLEAVLQLVVFLRGRWTFALAACNTVLNVVVAVPAIWLLSQGQLLNSAFWFTVIPGDDAASVYGILSVIVGFGIAGVAVWDTIDAFLKARRAR
ncbi:permease prefix domain 1-containing protein [Microbacterium sp.]|uniref:permease prefix domain 1-containing protein n=1 Tax=Microbacterium sp. TaxID=51671 RepID=UPI003C72050B